MRRGEEGAVTPHAVFEISDLEGLVIDAETPVPVPAIEILTAQLAARAGDEFRVLAAAPRIEEANERAGRAQVRLTHLIAKHFILSTQRAHRAEPNFARQLTILDEIVDERAEIRLPRMPVDQLRSLTGVPFTISLPASGNEVHFDAPRPLLRAAVDLAAREAAALHRRRAEVTTEQVLGRL
jgi:hypothetical protein